MILELVIKYIFNNTQNQCIHNTQDLLQDQNVEQDSYILMLFARQMEIKHHHMFQEHLGACN